MLNYPRPPRLPPPPLDPEDLDPPPELLKEPDERDDPPDLNDPEPLDDERRVVFILDRVFELLRFTLELTRVFDLRLVLTRVLELTEEDRLLLLLETRAEERLEFVDLLLNSDLE